MPWNRKSERCNVALIIIADYAVVRGGRHPTNNRNNTKLRMKKKRKEKRYVTLTRSVFVTSSMDTKILSPRQGWLIDDRTNAVASFALKLRAMPRFRETPCMSRVPVLTTAARHEYRCKIPRCIVDPDEPPVHPSISPIDGPTSREDPAIRGPAAKFANKTRRLLDISPRAKRSEHARENV